MAVLKVKPGPGSVVLNQSLSTPRSGLVVEAPEHMRDCNKEMTVFVDWGDMKATMEYLADITLTGCLTLEIL